MTLKIDTLSQLAVPISLSPLVREDIVRTYCKGEQLFATYRTASGDTFEKLMEANSLSCKGYNAAIRLVDRS